MFFYEKIFIINEFIIINDNMQSCMLVDFGQVIIFSYLKLTNWLNSQFSNLKINNNYYYYLSDIYTMSSLTISPI